MGHRSCVVRHRPTTLPGALSRTYAHRCLGRADKKRAPSRSPRSPTTYVIILEERRPGGSIGAASRSIIHLILLLLLPRDGSIVRLFQPILILDGFDELRDRVRERLTAGQIDRSSRSTTTASLFETRSGKSINEFAESSVRGRQGRATGIPNEYRTCESISEFEARSRVLERSGGPSSSNTSVAAGVERSFGSILILSSIAGLPVESSIRFVQSIQRKDSRINLERIVDLKKRFLIIAWLISAFHRLSNERAITRVKHVSIFLNKLSELVKFFQPAILEEIDSYETIYSSFLSRKPLIHVAISRAAVMTSGRRTSFRWRKKSSLPPPPLFIKESSMATFLDLRSIA